MESELQVLWRYQLNGTDNFSSESALGLAVFG